MNKCSRLRNKHVPRYVCGCFTQGTRQFPRLNYEGTTERDQTASLLIRRWVLSYIYNMETYSCLSAARRILSTDTVEDQTRSVSDRPALFQGR